MHRSRRRRRRRRPLPVPWDVKKTLEQNIQAAAAREGAEQGAQTPAGGAGPPLLLLVVAALGWVVAGALLGRVVAAALLGGIVAALLRWRVALARRRLLLVVAHVRARGVARVVGVPVVRLLLVRGLGRLGAGAGAVGGRFVVFMGHLLVCGRGFDLFFYRVFFSPWKIWKMRLDGYSWGR
ncbi:hypothetical protein F4802DRAFT_547519 [Xylaria palmicola]|nr:hypothetical protein F4802DRAFT_547519 [Xylaria palmicola]